MLEDTLELVRFQIERKKVKLNYFWDSSIDPYLESDVNRIKQVVINLLSNACKFTFEGSINVTVSD